MEKEKCIHLKERKGLITTMHILLGFHQKKMCDVGKD